MLEDEAVAWRTSNVAPSLRVVRPRYGWLGKWINGERRFRRHGAGGEKSSEPDPY